MKTLANRVTVAEADIKKYINWKKELLQKKTLALHELYGDEHAKRDDRAHFERHYLQSFTLPEADTDSATGICTYKTPNLSSAIDTGDVFPYNQHAMDMFGNQSELLKTLSDFNPDKNEFNLASMSGQYETILYPNTHDLLFGLTMNETCCVYSDYFELPAGFFVPDECTLNLRFKFRMDNQANRQVFKLVPGNTGNRLHDLVSVHGTVHLQADYRDRETNTFRTVQKSVTFLDMSQSSGTQQIGFYKDNLVIPLTVPGTGRFGVLDPVHVIANVYIHTITGRNFIPGEVLQSGKQYAFIDFREYGELMPRVTPDFNKRGAGGIQLQWYQVCIPEGRES
jgi:hypothetical protein